jgi:putative MFS transporter
MVGLVVFGRAADETAVLFLVVTLVAALNTAIAVLTVYSAEIFPTRLRARGAGTVAGAVKVGGFVGPIVMAAALTASGSPVAAATLLAALLVGAAVLIWLVSNRRSMLATAGAVGGDAW